MFSLPIDAVLKDKQSILIAGAGGGFDVYGGIPLWFALQREGRSVHLGSLSFTLLDSVMGRTEPFPGLTRIDADCVADSYYFPEGELSRWFRSEHRKEVPVWCFPKTGVKPLADKYRWLIQELKLDAIILVDGGVDSILRGDEQELGTPEEDAVSLGAIVGLEGIVRILCCVAMGAEKMDEISHFRVFENIAALTKAGGFLGAACLEKSMPEAKEFVSASWYGIQRTQPRGSVIMSSLISALHGEYGNYHLVGRTQGNELYINPLMPMCWFFDACRVAERNGYLRSILETNEINEVMLAIREWRKGRDLRNGPGIPL
jgi:hypothetical protein